MPPISSPNGMVDATVSKFTKILALSIRKDSAARSSQDSSSSSSQGGQSELKEYVRVTLTYPSPACGAMNPHKEIALRLTNDENPLFFYFLRITDADFPELKSQQGLLVDFYGFPNQLVTLLEKCDHVQEDGSGAKFVLVMKLGAVHTVLDIVESNPFKYLCHLSLHINAGTDGDVKKYLCDVTTSLKKDYQMLRDKYNHLASTMEAESVRGKEQMEMRNEEINQLRDQLHTQANSLSTKHFQDMTHEKEKLLKLQGELATKFEQERNDLERRHASATSNLEDRISSLENENRELLQNKYKSDTALQEAANKIKHCEEDLKLLQQEVTLKRKQNEKLDKDYHEKQRISTNLHNRVTSLETELRDKQGILQNNHEQVLQLTELKNNLEQHKAGLVSEVERLREANKLMSTELAKANEIIKKLQDNIRTVNSKIKMQTQVAGEQERIIIEKEEVIAEIEDKVNTLQNSLEFANTELTRLDASGKESASRIETLEKTIKSNENMISWLNKQLNEFQGLNNLTKFRQNLANSANHLAQNQNPINNSVGSTNINEVVPPPTSAGSKAYENYESALSGGRRNNFQITLPNGTPSWMHIYQSTSTPLDNDLSSRLEKVSTNPGLGMNYNDLKSRFADPFQNSNQKESPEDATKTNKSAGTARPPTWARGKGGRVTLDSGGSSNKPGILRR